MYTCERNGIMQALSLAIQMGYVKITSSSFLGLPVTNVSVFLPALAIASASGQLFIAQAH